MADWWPTRSLARMEQDWNGLRHERVRLTPYQREPDCSIAQQWEVDAWRLWLALAGRYLAMAAWSEEHRGERGGPVRETRGALPPRVGSGSN